MNVFDEIRADLELLSDLELFDLAREVYGLDVGSDEQREDVIDRCLAVEQHNCFA